MFLLIALCTHNRLHGEQRTEAEHEYVSLLNSVTGLYKRIRAHISDAEGEQTANSGRVNANFCV